MHTQDPICSLGTEYNNSTSKPSAIFILSTGVAIGIGAGSSLS